MHTYLNLDIYVKFANRCNILKWISYGIRAISSEIKQGFYMTLWMGSRNNGKLKISLERFKIF